VHIYENNLTNVSHNKERFRGTYERKFMNVFYAQ